eukprot:PLAT212.1.p1 GENE.PLAT212.1~~PLAT212.1.p1  ORF type:complete len:587 (-),score=232.55 PLAT212.1:82-1842(-)
MDKPRADYAMTMDSIRERLRVTPLPLQMPIGGGPSGAFTGVVDLLNMRKLCWDDELGESVTVSTSLGDVADDAAAARAQLVESVADMDDEIAELYLDDAAISGDALRAAIRRITLARSAALPVLFGSALRNRGVQPLMDAIVDYLPSPAEASPAVAHVVGKSKSKASSKAKSDADASTIELLPEADGPLAALAFKVQHDPHRGATVFFRVYSGTLKAGDMLLNSSRGVKERPHRLLQVRANDVVEVDAVAAGGIGAALGMRTTSTGDTLQLARDKRLPELTLDGVALPPPVFTCSIEPERTADEAALEEALATLMREDPSLSVTVEEETGQTLLSGMGELHMEIVKHRLAEAHKLEVYMGRMQVAYREGIRSPIRHDFTLDRTVGSRTMQAGLRLLLSPLDDVSAPPEIDVPDVIMAGADGSSSSGADASAAKTALPDAMRDAIVAGLTSGLQRGIDGYPLLGLRATVEEDGVLLSPASSPEAFRSAAHMAVGDALRHAEQGCVALLEPVMAMEISVPEERLGDALGDFSKRRGRVLGMDGDAGRSKLTGEAPLSELIGYATALRSLTKGEGSFSMQFLHYEPKGE